MHYFFNGLQCTSKQRFPFACTESLNKHVFVVIKQIYNVMMGYLRKILVPLQNMICDQQFLSLLSVTILHFIHIIIFLQLFIFRFLLEFTHLILLLMKTVSKFTNYILGCYKTCTVVVTRRCSLQVKLSQNLIVGCYFVKVPMIADIADEEGRTINSLKQAAGLVKQSEVCVTG